MTETSKFEELALAIRETVRQEMRGEFALRGIAADTIPLPHDNDAETAFLFFFLWGSTDANGLTMAEFHLPLHQRLFELGLATMGKPTRDQLLADYATAGTPVTAGVEAAIDDIMAPAYSPSTPPGHLAGVILEKARARRMCLWLKALDEDLRLGRVSVDAAKQKLVTEKNIMSQPGRATRVVWP